MSAHTEITIRTARKSDKLSKTAEEVKAGYIWHIVSAEESAIVKLEKMAY